MRLKHVAVILLALCCNSEAATADERISVIPSQICRGLWIVPVAFNDHPNQTLHLILDTGADFTSVDPDAIERVTGRRIREGKKIRLKNGAAGPLKFNWIKVTAHETDSLSRALGTQVDGILGFPVFDELLLTLDYPAAEIRVAQGQLAAADDQTIFRDAGKLRPFLAVEVGGKTVPVLVDSGATGGLTLFESDNLNWEYPPRVTSGSVRYRTIDADMEGRMKGSLNFGPLTIERPIVEVTDSGSRLAGWEILRRFVWTFDQRNNRIRMTADLDEPIRMMPVTGVGLIFKPQNGGFAVVRVLEDMPGERAGILKGDLVVAVDGTPVFERGCRSINDLGAGESTVLSVRRNNEIHEIRIQLDVLVP